MVADLLANGGFYVTKDDINSKTQFVAALRTYLKTGKTTKPTDNGRVYAASSPGEVNLIAAIADYFEQHDEIVDKESGIGFWYDVLKHIADAFQEFRTHAKYEMLRNVYRSVTDGSEIPDLFDIRHGRIRMRVLDDLARFLPLIAGRMDPYIGERLDGYFNCQLYLVEATWRVFIRQCYRTVAPRIKASRSRTHRGLFGRTYLEVNTMAGRVQYTFERTLYPSNLHLYEKITSIVDTPGAVPEDKYAAIEALLMTRKAPEPTSGAYEISFMGDESDMTGFRSGMNVPGSSISDYKACVAMIEDVIEHWNPATLVEV